MKTRIFAMLLGAFLLMPVSTALAASHSNTAATTPPTVTPTQTPIVTPILALILLVVITSACSSPSTQSHASGFTLSSPDLPAGDRLPAEYTCDGTASTLALAWSGAPAGTKSFVVIMHHIASPTDVHWYWVVYNIPAQVTGLAKNVTGIGTIGTNSVNKELAYAPPCSKGPGDKEYTYTMYALSAPQVSVPAAQATRDVMLAAIKDITLASAELHVVYARP